MSYYRDSPGKRSPYNRSPVKGLQSERDFIEEQIRLKNAYRSQSQNRRLLDEISLLQIKIRKTDDLEARCEALVKQNTLLTAENDHLAKQLSQRRYEVEKIRSNSLQLQERDNIKANQLGDINSRLQIEIQLLKKQRIESSKLYESHIQKLQIMLEDKIKQNEILSIKFNDLLNQKQINQLRYEEQRNKLKNMMTRTSYDMERQLEYTKEKQTTEKFVEIETLKKNYISQIQMLEDETGKLKAANAYKLNQFENQLQQNKNLKLRYEEEIRNLIGNNENLRVRILKLEEMNKTEVQYIQEKYSNIHTKDTSSLKEQHQREIRILLEEIDREKWIITEKNNEIQHLIREKREMQSQFRDRQLSLVTEIETLKNKISIQQAQAAEQSHNLMNKINDLHNKNFRDSENYFERVKNFQNKIKQLQNQINHKQNQYQDVKAKTSVRIQGLENQLEQTTIALKKTQLVLTDSQETYKRDMRLHQQYRAKSQSERKSLVERVSQLQVALENQQQNSQSLRKDLSNTDELLKIQIKSLRGTIKALEKQLSQQQASHSIEMDELSASLREKIQKLQATHKRMSEQGRRSHDQQIQTLRRRIEKLEREKEQMEVKLQEYIKLYKGLEKYFHQPHAEAVFKQKASDSIYQVLDTTSKSTVHIF